MEPRDILVMCPDIETYAPLIVAAFGLGEVPGKSHPAPTDSKVPWLYGPDGSTFVEKLSELGLLVDDEKQPTVE